MKYLWFSFIFFGLMLISCGRENFELPGEVIEEETDPIEIDGVFIEGNVLNEFGQSLTGVKVLLYNEESQVTETFTDDQGYFVFDDVENLTEEFRLVCLKEDHHAGIISLDITELIAEESIDVILFSGGIGTGIPEFDNPFNTDLVLIQGKIKNYQLGTGTVIFEIVNDFSQFITNGFSSNDGHFQLWVTKGLPFELIALDACHNILYQESFEPVFDVFEGVLEIEIETPQSGERITISGFVTDCLSQLPVESGSFLVSSGQLFFQEVEIKNGAFEFEVYSCLIGNSLEIFPNQGLIVSSPVIIATDQFQGQNEWILGNIEICNDQGGEVDLIINGTDSLNITGVFGFRNGNQILIFSNQFVCGLSVVDSEITTFEFIQISPDPLDSNVYYASEQFDVIIEVESSPQLPGDYLRLSFDGAFLDQNTFQYLEISGNLEVMVY